MEIADLNALVVFAQVVKQGSFIGAARHLNLPKATVSRRIQKLEAALQVKLLERSTRVVRPTELGKLYYGYCDRITAEIEEAQAAMDAQQAEPTGMLRTSAPSGFTQLFMAEFIPEFLGRYPQIQLIHRIVNHSVSPLRDGFDVSIRIGQIEDSQLQLQNLGEVTPKLFASPLYLKQYGVPETLSDLVRHKTIVTGTSHQPQWRLFNHDQSETLNLTPWCVINDPTLTFSLVVSGVGIGLLPSFLCTEAMQTNQITPILSAWSGPKVPLNAIFPTTYGRSPKVKVFLQLLKERLHL